MNKYITTDKLPDFVAKMWDAGMRVDLTPKNNTIAVVDSHFHTEFVYVFDKQSYDSLVEGLIEKKDVKDA